MVMHKFDVVDKENVCGRDGAGNSSTNYDDVTCLDCLRINEKEWQRQVDSFKGQPKQNAIKGLRIVQGRMNKIIMEAD